MEAIESKIEDLKQGRPVGTRCGIPTDFDSDMRSRSGIED